MPENLTKLLYVEDDESIAEIATMTLRDLGNFEVKHCFDGQSAIDAVSAYMPQLILMDVMMPGMDGPEAMHRIREMDDVKHIPIVFMTAKAQTHEQEAYLDLGVLGVIVKPFDPMTLCDELRAMWAQT